MEIAGKLQQISHCDPCALHLNTEGWILQRVLGSWGFFQGEDGEGKLWDERVGMAARCLWAAGARLPPPAASLGCEGCRLGLSGGLGAGLRAGPRAPLPCSQMGFDVGIFWIRLGTGTPPPPRPRAPALSALKTHPRRCGERTGSWGRQGGHRQWPGSEEGHIPILHKRKPSFLDTSRCPSGEKKTKKQKHVFSTYIQHLSCSPAVE